VKSESKMQMLLDSDFCFWISKNEIFSDASPATGFWILTFFMHFKAKARYLRQLH